jgi:alpha-N-acetylglucosamine transferase
MANGHSFASSFLKSPSHHIYRVFGLVTVFILLFSASLYAYHPATTIFNHAEQVPQELLQEVPQELPQQLPQQRRAYATFFSSRVENDTVDDPYFTATRVLTYQFLHHPSTRTQLDIPFLVLVPPHISDYKRQVLKSEGATVVPIELLLPRNNNTLSSSEKRWEDQFCKLRLFEMLQYDRILYLDTDMLLTKSLDGIWDEPAAQSVRTTGTNESLIQGDEAPLPSTYLFTGVSDTGPGHAFPPTEGNDINGGFWLIRPDLTLFNYYRSLMDIKGRFDTTFMEQSMLNYAHRRDGNMPWTAFPMGKWNANWPNEGDVKGGCASLHDKFWRADNKDWIDRTLVEMWWRMQGAMEGYWESKWLKTSG